MITDALKLHSIELGRVRSPSPIDNVSSYQIIIVVICFQVRPKIDILKCYLNENFAKNVTVFKPFVVYTPYYRHSDNPPKGGTTFITHRSGERHRERLRFGIRVFVACGVCAMTVPSHHDLITGLQQRDPQIVSWIYETYGPRVYHYLCRRLGDAELARDAHSEVFIRLLERATHYEDRGLPLTAWLFHLARDQAANIRRRAGRFVPLEAGNTEHDGDPETLLAPQWDWEHLQYVLAALPDHYRRVLWLRFGYDLSLEETARQLGCTVSAAKALQHRAMILARKLVREQPELIPNPRRTYQPPMA